jgi:hypothetical protein
MWGGNGNVLDGCVERCRVCSGHFKGLIFNRAPGCIFLPGALDKGRLKRARVPASPSCFGARWCRACQPAPQIPGLRSRRWRWEYCGAQAELPAASPSSGTGAASIPVHSPRAKKCKLVEQKDGRAEAKMSGGRAKKCKMSEQKFFDLHFRFSVF